MIFTPLVSPAVTPLEAQFAVPEYTVLGAYLSPLTSPALEAQHSTSHRGAYQQSSRSDTSIASSPADSLEHPAYAVSPTALTPTTAVATPTSATVTSQPGSAQRARRRSIPTRSSSRVVRQSPAMKPQRRRPALVTTRPAQGLIDLAHEPRPPSDAVRPRPAEGRPLEPERSGTDSISPEPLTEALMPPPPVPDTTVEGREALLGADMDVVADASDGAPEAQTAAGAGAGAGSAGGEGSGLHPATPASLMRLRKAPSKGKAVPPVSKPLAPAGSSSADSADRAAQKAQGSSHATPYPVPSASGDQAAEARGPGSPTVPAPGALAPGSTPTSADGPNPAPTEPSQGREKKGVDNGPDRKKAGVVGRGAKKRTNPNSVQASPALRPKISPGIKPLLPEGTAVSAETSTLLLASKSNYQNILEGNHLPGVSYPEALSTNLTSKRTSHKIAEQGRRNRINQALHEIAGLLPAGAGREKPCNAGDDGPNEGSPAQQQAGSKASTVEMAIAYIKELQRDLCDTKGQLEAAEKRLKERSNEPA